MTSNFIYISSPNASFEFQTQIPQSISFNITSSRNISANYIGYICSKSTLWFLPLTTDCNDMLIYMII